MSRCKSITFDFFSNFPHFGRRSAAFAFISATCSGVGLSMLASTRSMNDATSTPNITADRSSVSCDLDDDRILPARADEQLHSANHRGVPVNSIVRDARAIFVLVFANSPISGTASGFSRNSALGGASVSSLCGVTMIVFFLFGTRGRFDVFCLLSASAVESDC